MSVAMVRDLYEYHRWANHRLFDVAVALGEEACAKELGKHFSVPTLTRMFAHIYGADLNWLKRFKGTSPTESPFFDIPTMTEVRRKWDPLEAEQKAFVESLSEVDVTSEIHYKNSRGEAFQVALGVLLQHVANHATHHRSEIATMITLLSASPPDTGINTWILQRTGQTR
ncbi:MAG TPA: DinB family protein [Methylomirabilota bacterium]|nr:DinB family protein [Methylomirabilota bacterium]